MQIVASISIPPCEVTPSNAAKLCAWRIVSRPFKYEATELHRLDTLPSVATRRDISVRQTK